MAPRHFPSSGLCYCCSLLTQPLQVLQIVHECCGSPTQLLCHAGYCSVV